MTDTNDKLDRLASEIELESMESYRALLNGTDRSIIHQSCLDIFGVYNYDHKEFSQICIDACMESQQEVIIQARNIIKNLVVSKGKVTEEDFEVAKKFIIDTRPNKTTSNGFERMSKATLIIMRRLNQFSPEVRGKIIKSINVFYKIE